MDKFLSNASMKTKSRIFHKYGEMGVRALANATPKDSSKTANSWMYEAKVTNGSAAIYWSNTNVNAGVPIAVIIQYGHGTGTGGYVQGIDYINPAMKPVFKKMADEIWEEVTKR